MRRALSQSDRPRSEPTIALINIVFLMLIFFLIAGSLAPRTDGDVALVTLSEITTEPPSDAMVMLADGSLRHAGDTLTPEAALVRFGDTARVRLLPDRDAPAGELVAMAQGLRAAGVAELVIVTERGLE
ncbi:biopolymer transporter ExbD [Rhodobacteraceae bacterium 2376]|uniref:Biopolymer transporter ExbD n=1 Tax=Rhabdonatronobacter sediminivivens TaxID=2743469 RepID=A0A7Z0I194_9RHOB|nr:biopolymer transporter ExbD [Rhabdonatronobacter sediminivivens]NYS26096.1 biopolymer transporter ExbD [Rhabdonatronobacter sediminivivens]